MKTYRQFDGAADAGNAGRVSARQRPWRWMGIAVGLQCLAALGLSAAECETVPLTGNHKENGMWSALYAAKNGMVYIAAEPHGGEANFYQYNPQTKVMRRIANMIQAAGDYGKGVRSMSKIHTRFVEDEQGIIYFGTGNQGSGPVNIDPRTWIGGHWWSYDPAKDKVEDLGLVGRGSTDLYGLAYDRVRHRLYGMSWNGHLYVFDIATRVTTDAGRISNWDTCRTIVADDQGNCYGTFDKHQMFKYDAVAQRLLDIPVEVPHDPFQWPQASLQLDRKNIWRVAQWSDRDKVIYEIEGGASYLSRYDPRKGPDGSIEFLTQMSAPQFRGGHNTPTGSLSMTIGKDNRIYYAPATASFDYEPFSEGGGKTGTYLVSYDPSTGQRRDYGALIDQAGDKIVGTQGGACGPEGNLYFFGVVEVRGANKSDGKGAGKSAAVLKLIIVNPAHLVESETGKTK